MSHFNGTLQGYRGPVTREGSKRSGIVSRVTGKNGSIRVTVWYDPKEKIDMFKVEQLSVDGSGVNQTIAIAELGRMLTGKCRITDRRSVEP